MKTATNRGGNLTLEIRRGATFMLPCVYRNDGAAVDITGSSVVGAIADSDGNEVDLFDITVTDAANGAFVVSLSSTATEALPDGRLRYAVDLITGSVVREMLYGDVVVLEDMWPA